MISKNNRKILAVGLAGALSAFTGCDDGLGRLGPYSLIGDPPKVFLIAGGNLVSVRFDEFGMGVRVNAINSVQVPGPSSSPIVRLDFGLRSSGSRQGQGGGSGDPLTPPNADEHDSDSDEDYDSEDNHPQPDHPLPTQDHPGEDHDPRTPNDSPLKGELNSTGTPNDSVFSGELNSTNLSDGSVSTSSLGPNDLPQTQNSLVAAISQERTAKVSKIRIGAQPVSIKGSPDRKRFYVAYASGIAVIDRAAGAVVDQITLPPEAQPHSLAISPDGKRLYVTSYLSSGAQVYTVDLATKTVIGTIPVGGFPSGIAVTPDGSQIWVTSFFSGNVTVIDALTNTRTVVISNISAAWGIRFNPTGTRAYVTSAESVGGNLKVIETANYTVTATVPTGDGPRAIAVTPTGRHVFVANYGADTITQIDTNTNAVVRTITVGKNPQAFQFLR